MWIIPLSLISGGSYRLGGWKHGDTKYRDLGCGLVAMLSLYILGIQADWWAWFFSPALIWGAMSTYWKFGNPKAAWYHWAATGFFYGLALFLFPLYTGQWLGFILRTIFLTFTISIWSELISKDVLEEFGRGFLFNISLLFFLI